MAKLRCATCHEEIDDVQLALVRATDRGHNPARRGIFKIVHKGACDIPAETPERRAPSWELQTFAYAPDLVSGLVQDALVGAPSGQICFSDDSLVGVVRKLNPRYPSELVTAAMDPYRC